MPIPNDFILLDLYCIAMQAVLEGDSDLVVACHRAMTARAQFKGWV